MKTRGQVTWPRLEVLEANPTSSPALRSDNHGSLLGARSIWTSSNVRNGGFPTQASRIGRTLPRFASSFLRRWNGLGPKTIN